jgi:hypothetical protein
MPRASLKKAGKEIFHRGGRVDSVNGFSRGWEICKTAKAICAERRLRRERVDTVDRRHSMEKIDKIFRESNKENNFNSERQVSDAFHKLDDDKRNKLIELKRLRREEMDKGPADMPQASSKFAKKTDEQKVAERVDLGLKRTGIWTLCGCEDEIPPATRRGLGDRSIMSVTELRDYKAIVDQLTDNKPNMVYLSLQHRKINDDSVKGLCNALRCSTYVKVLSLEHNNITSAGCKQIGAVLRVLSTLQSLLLGSNLISDTGVEMLAKALRRNYGLLELNLVGRKHIVNDFAAASGGAVDQPPRITPWGITILANSLASHKFIRILSLGTNEIGDEGCRALTAMLSSHETLEHLELDNNGIGPEGARELGNALRTNKSLTFLNIAKNKIPDDGFAGLAKGLKVNKSMRLMDIAENQMGEEGANDMTSSIIGRGAIPLRLLFHGNPACDSAVGKKLAKVSRESEGAARIKFRKTAMSTMETLIELKEQHMDAVVMHAVETRRKKILESNEQLRIANQTMYASRKAPLNVQGSGPQVQLIPRRRIQKHSSPRRRSVWKEQFVGGESVAVLMNEGNDEGTAVLWSGGGQKRNSLKPLLQM